jgi:hypothetical protein
VITPNDALTVIAAGIGFVAACLLIAALASARHAQRAAYYIVRRHSQDQANRRFVWSLALAAVSVAAFTAGRIMPQLEAVSLLPEAASSLVPDGTPPAATQTAPPAERASTSTPASTAAPMATLTSPAPSPTRRATPLPEPTATPSEARLILSAVSAGVDEQGHPLTVTAEFTRGAGAVHLFFDHRGLRPGGLIRHNWFLDGNSVHYDAFAWQGPADGLTHVAWAPLEPGTYEVRVFLDSRLQFVANLLVK